MHQQPQDTGQTPRHSALPAAPPLERPGVSADGTLSSRTHTSPSLRAARGRRGQGVTTTVTELLRGAQQTVKAKQPSPGSAPPPGPPKDTSHEDYRTPRQGAKPTGSEVKITCNLSDDRFFKRNKK